jgi:diacylglycerol kinase family enzyme
MALVALLSNPNSTGNRAILPKIRSYCAARPDIFHYEVENSEGVGEALASIARVQPKVLVLNGGDGTVQAALTELYNNNDHFGLNIPPVAVLPNGKTNLIALDLGAEGDPLQTLEYIVKVAQEDLAPHLVNRELIALTMGESGADSGNHPVLGMFLGGAGLADIILYCRNKIYPLGLPNSVSHFLAAVATIISIVFGVRGKYFPDAPNPVRVSLIRDGETNKRFSFLIVTTLQKLLFGSKTEAEPGMGLRLLAVEQSGMSILRAFFASLRGTLGTNDVAGVHVKHGDMIRIESDRASVILDGETFSATKGRPIILRSTPPVPFLKIAH